MLVYRMEYIRLIKQFHASRKFQVFNSECIVTSINRQTVDVLEKYRASAALQLSVSHDRNAIAENVGFFHVMCWQDHRASGSLTLKDVPRLSSRLWIHSGRRFIQNDNLTTQYTLPSLVMRLKTKCSSTADNNCQDCNSQSDHGVARQCLHCCKSDQLSLWRMAKLGVSVRRKPKPIVTKFGTGNYAGDMTAHAKIQTNRPRGGVPANRWNITLTWFSLLSFLWPEILLASQDRRVPKDRFLCCLIHNVSIPGNYISTVMKLQKFLFPHLYPHKHTQKGAQSRK